MGKTRKAISALKQKHNNAPINLSVTQAAKSLIHDGKYDQGVLNRG